MSLERKMSALSAPLPEDILKKKWAGDFEGALALIDYRLTHAELTEMMRNRLEIEREILKQLPEQYPYNREKAMEIARESIPDFTTDELDQLELEGALDYIYVHGERHYYRRFFRTLLHVNPYVRKRAGIQPDPDNHMLDDTIASLKKNGEERWHIRIRHTMRVRDEAFIPSETYLAHLPIPKPSAQTGNIRLTQVDADAIVAPAAEHQRTVAFRRTLAENAPFAVEYEYDNVMRYIDPLAENPGVGVVYPDAVPPCKEDLAELAPHICFTPYLRDLAAELAGDETRPVYIARRFYDYCTTRVKYTFMRDYFLVDNGSEYAALNQKGDCGIQALLFITLCRIAGIPARWQSGLYTPADGIGNHDWAQFYVEPYGWLFCDCSFGGSAWRSGCTERWNFYFGNLDPYRMVANDCYQQSFNPPKQHLRIDPYDNQCGECECSARGFTDPELSNYNYDLLELKRI